MFPKFKLRSTILILNIIFSFNFVACSHPNQDVESSTPLAKITDTESNSSSKSVIHDTVSLSAGNDAAQASLTMQIEGSQCITSVETPGYMITNWVRVGVVSRINLATPLLSKCLGQSIYISSVSASDWVATVGNQSEVGSGVEVSFKIKTTVVSDNSVQIIIDLNPEKSNPS